MHYINQCCAPRAQYQYMASWTEDEGWRGALKPYGPLELLPSAQVLNYGQSIFEGMKVGQAATVAAGMQCSVEASPSLTLLQDAMIKEQCVSSICLPRALAIICSMALTMGSAMAQLLRIPEALIWSPSRQAVCVDHPHMSTLITASLGLGIPPTTDEASELLSHGLTQAQRSAEGRIVLFRPDMNCARMAAGADRMCMPEVPDSIFIDAVKQV